MSKETTFLQTPSAPSLPVATTQYTQRFQDQYSNVLRLYFNRLSNALSLVTGNEGGQYLSFPYGAFLDTTTQTAAATSTAYSVKFNTTTSTNSVTVDTTDTSKIIVDEEGVYNFAFSLQLDKASGAAGHTYIWARVNGVDVENSASEVAIQGTTAENIAAWNFFLSMQPGDYFQLMWSVDDTNIQIKAVAATSPVPAIPSSILTVNFISKPPINASA